MRKTRQLKYKDRIIIQNLLENNENATCAFLDSTSRIKELTEHLKENPKDHHSRRGMLKMIGQRKGLLAYLKGVDIERYRSLIERLGLRK